MAGDGIEYVDIALLAFGCKAAPAPAMPRAHVGRLSLLKWRQTIDGTRLKRCGPGRPIKKHTLGRYWFVGRCAERMLFKRLQPGIVVLGNLFKSALHRLIGQMIEAHADIREIIEQCLQVIVKKRQPVLLTGITLTGANGLIKRVVTRSATEQLDIAAAKKLLRLLA